MRGCEAAAHANAGVLPAPPQQRTCDPVLFLLRAGQALGFSRQDRLNSRSLGWHQRRLVYRYFLEQPAEEQAAIPLTTILTTHSSHIASVSPIRSIVLLRRDAMTRSTMGVSTARVPLTDRDEADLARYIDVT